MSIDHFIFKCVFECLKEFAFLFFPVLSVTPGTDSTNEERNGHQRLLSIRLMVSQKVLTSDEVKEM